MIKALLRLLFGNKVPLGGFAAAQKGYSIKDNPYNKRKNLLVWKRWNEDWSFYHKGKFK